MEPITTIRDYYKRLGPPHQGLASFDQNNADGRSLLLYILKSLSFTLDPARSYALPVLHWWIGPATGPKAPPDGPRFYATLALLLADGAVARVQGWSSVASWLDMVWRLGGPQLKTSPLKAWARPSANDSEGLPRWTFDLAP